MSGIAQLAHALAAERGRAVLHIEGDPRHVTAEEKSELVVPGEQRGGEVEEGRVEGMGVRARPGGAARSYGYGNSA